MFDNPGSVKCCDLQVSFISHNYKVNAETFTSFGVILHRGILYFEHFVIYFTTS